MKAIYYTLICFSLLITHSAPIHAQKESARRNEHFIDLAFGAEFNTSSYKSPIGEIVFQGKQRAYVSIIMKYQYFFHKHWGAFLSLNSNGSSPYSEERLMDKMEKQPASHYYTYTGSMDKDDIMQGTYTLGAMYRQDIHSWSFRPYLAFGCAQYMHANTIDYLRKEEGNNQVEQVKVTVGNNKNLQYGFCLSPGIYISKAVASIVYLTADFFLYSAYKKICSALPTKQHIYSRNSGTIQRKRNTGELPKSKNRTKYPVCKKQIEASQAHFQMKIYRIR